MFTNMFISYLNICLASCNGTVVNTCSYMQRRVCQAGIVFSACTGGETMCTGGETTCTGGETMCTGGETTYLGRMFTGETNCPIRDVFVAMVHSCSDEYLGKWHTIFFLWGGGERGKGRDTHTYPPPTHIPTTHPHHTHTTPTPHTCTHTRTHTYTHTHTHSHTHPV